MFSFCTRLNPETNYSCSLVRRSEAIVHPIHQLVGRSALTVGRHIDERPAESNFSRLTTCVIHRKIVPFEDVAVEGKNDSV